MSLFVKICGLCRAADVEAAAACRPDALGFVFWPGSRRCVAAADVDAWTRTLPPGLLKVGVFVDQPPEEVRAAARTAGLDVVQLHGAEGPGACAAAWPRVWKALKADADDPRRFAPYPVEAVVLDSGTASMPGGTGLAGDWPKAARFVQECGRPVLLAGGLRPENVAEAVRIVGPWGVDVSSGVELAPGRKDAARIEEFVRICRSL